MKKIFTLAAILLLISCSTDDSTNTAPTTTVSQYKGSWIGTMTKDVQTSPVTGNATVSIIIDKDGNIQGGYQQISLGYFLISGIITTTTFSLSPDLNLEHGGNGSGATFTALTITPNKITGTWKDVPRSFYGTFEINKN